jgi:hypothetical protein
MTAIPPSVAMKRNSRFSVSVAAKRATSPIVMRRLDRAMIVFLGLASSTRAG